MIYYINFAILLFLALVVDILPIKQFKRFEQMWYVIMSIYLLWFVAFRVDTGYDFYNYKRIFESVSSLNFMQLINTNYFGSVEIGYLMLNFLLKNFSYSVFLIFTAMLAMLPKLIYIDKFMDTKMLGLFFYYATIMVSFDMGIVRQSIAMGICLWAYQYLSEKKYKKFVFAILLAALFHVSVLIVLSILLFQDKIYTKKFYFVTIILAFIIAYIQPLKTLISIVSHISNGYIVRKIVTYAFSYSRMGDTADVILFSVLKRLVLFLIFSYMVMRDTNNAKKTKIYVYYNAFYLSIVIALLVIEIPILAGRGTTYMQIVQMFLFAELIEENSHRGFKNTVMKRILTFALCCALSLYTISGVAGDPAYVPYKNIMISNHYL